MQIIGLNIPPWILDWSGSLLVVLSLVFLFRKHPYYWHASNASLLPYFLLFLTNGQFMLAGLQVTYLMFGLHGLYLWHLETLRSQGKITFREGPWYAVTWAMSVIIFLYTVFVTDFSDQWNWVQFTAVTLALTANFGTTRRWAWSWPVWMLVNVVQAIYFWHLGLYAQFALQFVLFTMSYYGWRVWLRDERTAPLAQAL